MKIKRTICERNGIISVTAGVEILMVPIETEEKDIREKLETELAVALTSIWNIVKGPKCSMEEVIYTSTSKDDDNEELRISQALIIHVCDREKKAAERTLETVISLLYDRLILTGYFLKMLDEEELYRVLSKRTGNGSCIFRDEESFSSPMSRGSFSYYSAIGNSRDLSLLYKTIAAHDSNCLSVQLIPANLSQRDKESFLMLYKKLNRMAEGYSMGGARSHDINAKRASQELEYYYERMNEPMFRMMVTLHGVDVDRMSAIYTGMMKTKGNTSIRFCSIPLLAFPTASYRSFYPWDIEKYINSSVGQIEGQSTYISHTHTTEEISKAMVMPTANSSYAPIRGNAFSLLNYTKPNHEMTDKKNIFLGYGFDATPIYLPIHSLKQNMNIFAAPGFGKTTVIKNIIYNLYKRNINTLVIECVKNEFRSLLDLIPETKLYHVENAGIELRMNPFLPCAGIKLSRYLPHLREVFKTAFVLEAPLDSLVENALGQAYRFFGWKMDSQLGDEGTTVFGLREFIDILQKVIASSSYEPKLKGNLSFASKIRLLKLIESCNTLFDTKMATPMEELLKGTTVVNVTNIPGEERNIIISLLLIRLIATIKTKYHSSSNLNTVIVLDEAHTFLDCQSDSEAAKMMQRLIENMVAEFRGLGVGVIISDQVPSRVGEKVMACAGTNLIMKLGDLKEASLVKGQVQLDETGVQALGCLSLGQAVLSSLGQEKALPLYLVNFEAQYKSRNDISDEEVNKYYRKIKMHC